MSADFWAGYVSGAAGILIGNPLDIVKVNLQRSAASDAAPASFSSRFNNIGALLKGTTAPVLGYGALNALMFVTYNRSMLLLGQDPAHPTSLGKTWLAGALGGLATFVVSAPTELIKCRAQVAHDRSSSFSIARQLWREGGLRALYRGGTVTSVRDTVGYGFYFWSYELSKKTLISSTDTEKPEWMAVLLCGGIAGVVTWASVFPLDVIKTRVQTQGVSRHATTASNVTEQSPLLQSQYQTRLGTIQIAKQAYRDEGMAVFFRGLGVCSVRAFFVNAVQWAVYEWMMQIPLRPDLKVAT